MALWTPADITTTLWLDASDATTITESSGSVSQWNDKSGNGYNYTQATSTNQPITNSRTINSLNVLDFDGNNDFMQLASGFQPGSNNSIIMAVVNNDRASVTQERIMACQNGLGTRFGLLNNSANIFEQPAGQQYLHASSFVVASQTYQSGTHIVGGYRNGTTLGSSYDGNTPATSTNGSDAPTLDKWFIGCYNAATENYDGAIAEIVVVLDYDATTYQKLEGYLAHKWGLDSSLPAGHPYKESPPAVGVLDRLTSTPEACSSLRRLRGGYVGPLIKVRETGLDTEADIGFDANGDLDTAALLAHCGSNSGFVTVWYDQSGNGHDMIQTTDANQLRIVNAGVIDTNSFNTKALHSVDAFDGFQQTNRGSYYTGTTMSGSVVGQFGTVNNHTRFLSVSKDGAADWSGTTGALLINRDNTTQTIQGFRNGTKLSNATLSNDQLYVFTSIWDGANHTLYVDGTGQTPVANTGAFDHNNINLLKEYTGSYQSEENLKYSEYILFLTDIGTTDRQTLENDQIAYWMPSTSIEADLDTINISRSMEDASVSLSIEADLDTINISRSMEDASVSIGSIILDLTTINISRSMEDASVSLSIEADLDTINISRSMEDASVSLSIEADLDTINISRSMEDSSVSLSIEADLDTINISRSMEDASISLSIEADLDTINISRSMEDASVSFGLEMDLTTINISRSMEDSSVSLSIEADLDTINISRSMEDASVSFGLEMDLTTINISRSMEDSSVSLSIEADLDTINISRSMEDSAVSLSIEADLDTINISRSMEDSSVSLSIEADLDTINISRSMEDSAVSLSIEADLDTINISRSMEDASVTITTNNVVVDLSTINISRSMQDPTLLLSIKLDLTTLTIARAIIDGFIIIGTKISNVLHIIKARKRIEFTLKKGRRLKMEPFIKQPSEIIPIGFNYEDLLQDTESISSLEVKAYLDGVDVTSTIIDSSAIDGFWIKTRLKGGADGLDYKITAKAYTDEGNTYEVDALMFVREI